jgi:hypothetical protein
MADALLLAAAQLGSICGMAWLALSMKGHWQQVRGAQPLEPGTLRNLRVLGFAAQLVSLVLLLLVDHASMATLVWVMSMSASVVVVAFTLTWRPRLLAWLVPASRPVP